MTKKQQLDYLNKTLQDMGHHSFDEQIFLRSIRDVIIMTSSMADISNKSNLGKESMYKALSGKNKPRMDTIIKIMVALGMRLMLVKKDEASHESRNTDTSEQVRTT